MFHQGQSHFNTQQAENLKIVKSIDKNELLLWLQKDQSWYYNPNLPTTHPARTECSDSLFFSSQNNLNLICPRQQKQSSQQLYLFTQVIWLLLNLLLILIHWLICNQLKQIGVNWITGYRSLYSLFKMVQTTDMTSFQVDYINIRNLTIFTIGFICFADQNRNPCWTEPIYF